MRTIDEIVKALRGEQYLMCFDPLSGKIHDPCYLTDMNRNSYLLYGDAADLIERQAKEIASYQQVKKALLHDVGFESLGELLEAYTQVKCERDAAIADLYRAKPCETCAKQYKDDCLLEGCMDPCSTFAGGDLPYEWRGLGDFDER